MPSRPALEKILNIFKVKGNVNRYSVLQEMRETKKGKYSNKYKEKILMYIYTCIFKFH